MYIARLIDILQERLGKPTRVISDEYPNGIPSRSPLCTDIDVMMICKSLLTTHDTRICDRLMIMPSMAAKGLSEFIDN